MCIRLWLIAHGTFDKYNNSWYFFFARNYNFVDYTCVVHQKWILERRSWLCKQNVQNWFLKIESQRKNDAQIKFKRHHVYASPGNVG